MGAKASTALAIAVVPHGLESKVEEALAQMLGGAIKTLAAAGCALAGGHSSEGEELALGGRTISQSLVFDVACTASAAGSI